MKNKKMMTMLLALGLVTATGVGASLAYLTDSTEELENKFTFAKGIQMQLDEDKVDPDTHTTVKNGTDAIVAGGNETGNTYNNILPGDKLHKDPTVEIKTSSPDCYVFVSVKNPSKDTLKLNIKTSNNNGYYWSFVKTVNGTDIYVLSQNNAPKVVQTTDKDRRFVVFDEVTVENTDGSGTLSNIIVKSSAVQSKVNGVDSYSDVEGEGLAFLEEAAQ